MTSFSKLLDDTPASAPLLALAEQLAPARLGTREELALAARLAFCRQELLAVALLDPASRLELARLCGGAEGDTQRAEAIVPGGTAFRSRATGSAAPGSAAPGSAAPDRARQVLQELRARAEELHARAKEPELSASRELVRSLPVEWAIAERLCQHTWVGALSAGAERGPSRLPIGLSRHVRELKGEVTAIVGHFVVSHQALVGHVVRRYQGLGLGRDDLMQDGNIGLMRALERFDPAREKPFASYAVWWIREAVRRALAQQGRTIRLPVHAIAMRSTLGHASRRLSQELGREPTEQELAAEMGVTASSLAHLARLSREPLSLDAPRSDSGEITVGDTVADSSIGTPNDLAAAKQQTEHVRVLLESLEPRERQVLQLRFGLDGGDERTLEEIGRSIHLTRERVRQIVGEALGKLHRQTQRRQLEL